MKEYSPYKMKGHTLPGINQRSEGNTDLPDGRSGSSPFQEKDSRGFTICHKRKPIAMCGITSMDKYMHTGKIWFLKKEIIKELI